MRVHGHTHACTRQLPHVCKQFSDTSGVPGEFNSVLTLSTQTQHQLLQVPNRLAATPDPRQMPVLLVTCTDYKLEVPVTSPFGSINLLEGLPELRETRSLLGPWFTTRSRDSGTADGRDVQGEVWGKAAECPCSGCAALPESPQVYQPEVSPNPVLSGFCGGFVP